MAGEDVVLTAVVTNYGPDAAPDNTVTVGIPGGTDYVSDDGGCTLDAGVLTCAGAGMALNGVRTINVTVTVPSDIAEGADLGPLIAYVQTTGDQGANDNGDTVTIDNAFVHRVANLAVVKSGPDGIDPLVVAGDTDGYDYTLTVSTVGPSDAGFTIADTLATGLTFQTLGSDPACTADGQDVTCGSTIVGNGAAQTSPSTCSWIRPLRSRSSKTQRPSPSLQTEPKTRRC